MRAPIKVTPVPVIPTAPLPVELPEGEPVGGVFVVVLVGVDVLVVPVLVSVVVVVLVPGEVLLPMLNALVSESVVLTSPAAEAWKVYPDLHVRCKCQVPISRDYSEVGDLPRFDCGNDHSDISISGCDSIFQRNRIAQVVVGQVYKGECKSLSLVYQHEDHIGLTKVKRSGVLGGSCPGNRHRTPRGNWSSRWAELQGRDEGKGDEECTATQG